MGRPARLRRKLRRAEHFATLAADVAALAGNAKSGARLAPAQRGRMGASPTAVKAARGAENASKEPYVAENAAATRVVAHAMQEGTFVTVLISGEAWPAVFTGGVVHVIGSMASPALVPPASRTLPAPNFCRASQGGSETTHNAQHPTPITIAHHPVTPRCHTHTELPPGPGPLSNPSLIPTRQTLPGRQSEQRSLAERQGSLGEVGCA